MRYVLFYTQPSGASVMKTGEAADDEDEIRRFLPRAPIGTELWRLPPGQDHIGRSEDLDDRMGTVEECNGSCDRHHCTRHWFIDTDVFRREP